MGNGKRWQWWLGSVLGLGSASVALAGATSDFSALGPAGIDAARLHRAPHYLTGRKIAVGQVEIGRPGQFGLDKAVQRNQSMTPTQVFYRDQPARRDKDVAKHSQNVASVIISQDKMVQGVAPGARLFAAAAGTARQYGQPEECLAAQHIAQRNGGDVRVINFSFGEPLEQDPRPDPRLDGNALLTQCLDWSARVHQTLYVVAGNQGRGGISIPTDNFNGINVAFTMRQDGAFRKIGFANLGDPAGAGWPIAGIESNVGPRRAIGLAAPGDRIPMLNLDGSVTISSGTSFAAPHVTGTVALLQEYGDRQLHQSCQPQCARPWTPDARRPDVMKAVLLNAADKLQDTGNGWRLGMRHTILDKTNRTWLAADAARDPKIPLHIQMGTGQLNAFRALQQFQAGQWAATAPVPAIGWDYSTLTTSAPVQDYVIQQPLQQGSFVSVTLAWQRHVELVDPNGNGRYDLGETFRDRGLNNLNLYLLPATATDTREAIAASISDVDSVEHLFAQIPATGRYKLRVELRQTVNTPTQPYAIAWWGVLAR